jgi:hypothetical protein
MDNFFTRLAERSLGGSPVVRPTITPRFSPVSSLVDELERVSWGKTQGLPSEPEVTPKPISRRDVENPPVPAIADVQPVAQPPAATEVIPTRLAPLAPLTPDLAQPSNHPVVSALLNPQKQPSATPQIAVPPSTSLTAASQRPVAATGNLLDSPKPFRVSPQREPVSDNHPSLPVSQSRGEGSDLVTPIPLKPAPRQEQPSVTSESSVPSLTPLTVEAIAPQQPVAATGNLINSPRPFRVSPQREPFSDNHPSLPVPQPRGEGSDLATSIPVELAPPHRSPVQNQTGIPGRMDDGDRPTASAPPSTQLSPSVDLGLTLASPVLPVAAPDREPIPPTVRVSIGRVEVRAVMPTAPTPRAVPTRPRPAVSLNDYLKQRGGKP